MHTSIASFASLVLRHVPSNRDWVADLLTDPMELVDVVEIVNMTSSS